MRVVLTSYRIIEIEWAVKNGKAFKPSPKRVKKEKRKRKADAELEAGAEEARDMDVDHYESGPAHVMSDDQMEVDEVASSLTMRAATFGHELTNTGSKRALLADDDTAGMETPAKRPKHNAAKAKNLPIVMIESDEEDEGLAPDAAPRKRRRRVAAAV